MFAIWWRTILTKLMDSMRSSKRQRRSRWKNQRDSTYRIWFEPLESRWCPATFRWSGAVNANWNHSGNWVLISGTGGFPNAIGDIAQFTNNNATSMTAVVNVNVTVGTIEFAGNKNYTINNSGGSTLTLQVGSGSATLSVALNTTGTSTISAPVKLNSSVTVTHRSAIPLTISGVVSGAGGFTMNTNSAGTLVLTGSNTYTGSTAINAGAISIAANSGLGATTSSLSFNGGALQVTGTMSTARSITLNSSGGTFAVNSGQTLTISSAMTGPGNMTKAGAGTLVLTGKNTYTGNTAITNGLLRAGTIDTFTKSKLLSLSSGSTFDANSLTQSMGSLSGSGAISLGSANLTIGSASNSAPGTFSGVISGTGALIKAGAVTQVVTGSNTYSGGTTINGGTLTVSNVSGSGSGPGPVTVNSPGRLWGTGTVSGSITVNNNGIASPHPGLAILNAGNADFSSGGELLLQVRGNATPGVNYDRLDLGNGTLTLGGTSKITLDLENLTALGTVVGIATYGSHVGTFTTVNVINNPFGLVPTLIYHDTHLDIDVVGSTTTVLTSSANPSVFGQTVTITATVSGGSPALGTPTGTVTFLEDGTPVSTMTLSSGSATYVPSVPLAVGSYSISAIYSGDVNFLPSTSTVLVQTVNPASTTTTLPLVQHVPFAGQTAIFTATVSVNAPGAGNPPGTVTFYDGTTALGTATVSSGSVTFTTNSLAQGSYMIHAVYGGDTSFSSSTSTAIPVKVQAAPAAMALAECPCDCVFLPIQTALGLLGFLMPIPTTGNPIRYHDGVISLVMVDLDSFGFGVGWDQSRSWTNGEGYATNSANGNGTVNPHQMKLLQAAGDDSVIIAVSNGTTARYFDLVSSDYVPRYFFQEALTHDTLAHTFTLIDTTGNQLIFHDFDGSVPLAQRGQLKEYIDPAGDVTSLFYDGNGRLTDTQRSRVVDGQTITESYLMNYVGSGILAGLVESVTLRRRVDAGPWQLVRQVDYTYYDGSYVGSMAFGNAGDLRTAVISDSNGVIDTKYYRYYTPGEPNGYVGGLKFIVNPESFSRLQGAIEGSPFTASDGVASLFADNYFEYDAFRRVTKEVVQGEGCSACADGLGTFTYSYTISDNGDGFNSWKVRTVETLSDGNQNVVFTNAYGQVMLKVFRDTTTNDEWITFTKYDEQGRAILSANPSAVSGYDEDKADLLDEVYGNYQYLRDDAGLIAVTTFYTSTTATGTTAGSAAGYVHEMLIQQGELGTAIPQITFEYFIHSGGGATVFPVATSTVYRNDDGSGGQTTSFSYTFFADSTRIESMTTTLPVVSVGQNGTGTADEFTTVFNQDGRPIWMKDAEGFLTYLSYDVATGALVKLIQDVDTDQTDDFADLPSGWNTPGGGGLHLIDVMEVDALGRTVKSIDPKGNVTYTIFNDVGHEVRIYAGWNSISETPTGPTLVARQDRLRGYVETLTMTAAPDVDLSGRPIGTEAISDLQSLARSYTNFAGQVVSIDEYFDLTGLSWTTSTTLGVEGENFYRTQLSYDKLGLLSRIVSPTDTITRMVHDGLGRTVSVWVGTNDTPAEGFWSPSNNDGTSDMVQLSEFSYDNGGVGDSNLTSLTMFPGGSEDPRVNDYFHDWRNRLIAIKEGIESVEDEDTNRPITFLTLDNLNQVVQIRVYDGDDVTISTVAGEPQAPSSGLLVSRSTLDYDDQGRIFASALFNPDDSPVTSTEFFYTPNSELAKTIDGEGNYTLFAYDGVHRLIASETYDANDTLTLSTAYQYDGNHNLIRSTDGVGNYTLFTHDAIDRPLTMEVYDSNDTLVLASSTTYLDSLRSLRTTDGVGNFTIDEYDPLGRLVETATYNDGEIAVLVTTSAFAYDGNHNLVRVTDGEGNYTVNTYNFLDQLTATATYNAGDVLAFTAAFSYNLLGDLLQSTDGEGNYTDHTYDVLGWLLTTDSYNADTTHVFHASYLYDVLGNVSQMTDGEGNYTVFTFDAGSQLLSSETFNENGTLVLADSYTYDLAGRMTQMVDGVGNYTNLTYNAIGQILTNETFNAGDTLTLADSYTYDLAGRMTQMVDGVGNYTNLTYNAIGQVLTSETFNAGDTLTLADSYTYDLAGRMTQMVDGVGNYTNLVYNAIGQVLSSETFNAGDTLTLADSYTYDLAGRMTQMVDGVGNYTNLSYNAIGQVLGSETFNAGDTLTLADSYTYDLAGRMTQMVDGVGNYTNLVYNAIGQVLSSETFNAGDTLTLASSNTYDLAGRMTQMVDGVGNYTNLVYDAVGQVLSSQTFNENGTLVLADSYTYDLAGRMTQMVDGVGNYTNLVYNAIGQVLTSETFNAGDTLTLADSYTYDLAGRMTQMVDGVGNYTNLTYNAIGQVLTSETFNAGDTLTLADSYTYDLAGRMTQMVDGVGNYTNLSYNAIGQVLSSETFNENGTLVLASSNTYDLAGRMTQMVDGVGNYTNLAYNAIGQVLNTETYNATDTLVTSMSYVYNLAGELVQAIDGNSNITLTVYNAVHQPTSVTVGYGTAAAATTVTIYALNGFIASITDPVGNTTTYVRNALGLAVEVTDPLEETRYLKYDLAGQLIEAIDRNGRKRTMEYDGTGRLLTETWFEGEGVVDELSYTYSLAGELLSASNNAGTYTMTYDGGLLKTQTDPHGLTLTFGHDLAGRITSVEDPGGTTSSVYDGAGNLTRRTFTDGDVELRVDLTYDLAGNMLTVTRYADLAGTEKVGFTQYTWNGNRLMHIQHQDGDENVLADFDYDYDLGLRLTFKDDNGIETDFGYDSTNQLTSADGNEYDYDLAGNRSEDMGYFTGLGNRLQSDGTWTYSHDLEGNLIKKSLGSYAETWIYEYDHWNRLVRIEQWSEDPDVMGTGYLIKTWQYHYDVFGNRIQQDVTGAGTTKFAYIGLDAWADLDSEYELQARRIYLDGVDQLLARIDSRGTAWYLTDHLGSVRSVTDDTGALQVSITFDEFGNPGTPTGTDVTYLDRYGFTAREFDPDTGLQYNRARFYDPMAGRWLSEDPIDFASGDPNFYRYVSNGPVNAVDPNGLYETDIHFYMTYYLARAVGLDDAELVNTEEKLRVRGGKPVSPAFTIAWFAQHVDDNRLTTPLPEHIGDINRVFNDDILFWHFYAVELEITTLRQRAKLVRLLKELGGPQRQKIKGKYFKSVIPLPVTSNSKYVQELLDQTMRTIKDTDKMLPTSDAMFGMVLHTYEDSWSHAGFQLPFGHGAALYGGHGPDIPWVEPRRATEMAEHVYNKLKIYAERKYGIKKAKFEWNEIKDEVAALMECGKELDSEKYRKGDKLTHEQDMEKRIANWQNAIKQRFKDKEVTTYEYRKDKGAQLDEWAEIFKDSITHIKPKNGRVAPVITDVDVFVQLVKEAYEELDKRKSRILPEKERVWLDLLRNVYEETKKIKK